MSDDRFPSVRLLNTNISVSFAKCSTIKLTMSSNEWFEPIMLLFFLINIFETTFPASKNAYHHLFAFQNRTYLKILVASTYPSPFEISRKIFC